MDSGPCESHLHKDGRSRRGHVGDVISHVENHKYIKKLGTMDRSEVVRTSALLRASGGDQSATEKPSPRTTAPDITEHLRTTGRWRPLITWKPQHPKDQAQLCGGTASFTIRRGDTGKGTTPRAARRVYAGP